MAALMVRPARRQLAVRNLREFGFAAAPVSRKARDFANEAILSQLSRRLNQLDDLMGKLAFSLREITGARDRVNRPNRAKR